MENDNKRNEIIRIFRRYARFNLASEGLNPIQIYKKIDVICSSRRSKLDMLAVFDTIRLLELMNDNDTLLAINRVYFDGRAHRVTKYELGRRVCALAQEQYCDERTIYRRLEKARNIFEKIRQKEGLILDGLYPQKYGIQKQQVGQFYNSSKNPQNRKI